MIAYRILLVLSIASAHRLVGQAAAVPHAGLSQVAPSAVDAGHRARLSNEVVASNNWARGAVIGGAIGTAIGLFFYRAFAYETHGSTYVVGWAFAGALIGGLIGSGSPKT